MSNSYCTVLCVLLLLGSEIGCVHGRCLKCKRCRRCPVKAERIKRGGKVPYVEIGTSKVATLEDFRPTTPGHSPGAGHAIRN